MIAHVYKPKRRKNGKVIVQRNYRGRYRLKGEFEIKEIALNTADKQVARVRLMAIVQESERERAGLIAPRAQRDAIEKSLAYHLAGFLADLTALGRTENYRLHIKGRIEKLIKECQLATIKDISTETFTTWRSKQTGLSPKTLNEYLNALNGLMNWLRKQGKIEKNPLANVTKVDLRGRQLKRRAFTEAELVLICEKAPARRLLYLTAAFTGLRQNELRQLVWSDTHLDEERPYLLVRAKTTKNRKTSVLPLHPKLASELIDKRSSSTHRSENIFKVRNGFCRIFTRDLARAQIPPIDDTGRKADFHSLRYTFATRLAVSGISQRVTQELMRHSDPSLTANVYTDARQLPTFDAVASLTWQSDRLSDTQIDPQKPDASGLNETRDGKHKQQKQNVEALENQQSRQGESQCGRKEGLVEPWGIEPQTPTMPLWCSTN